MKNFIIAALLRYYCGGELEEESALLAHQFIRG